jgi:hypothetical protein
MAWLIEVHNWSERRACQEVWLARSTARDKRRLDRDEAVIAAERLPEHFDSVSVVRYRRLGRARYLDDQLADRVDGQLPASVTAMIAGFDAIRTRFRQAVPTNPPTRTGIESQ